MQIEVAENTWVLLTSLVIELAMKEQVDFYKVDVAHHGSWEIVTDDS